jgi:alpha-tubulin suppressor-like RCC1 family protein
VLTDGTVECWGFNMYGELGDGTTTPSFSTTVTVLGIMTAKSIDLGSHHSCAVLIDGKVKCSYNNKGQLGDGTTTDRSTPVEVSGITSATSIVLGSDHSCAVLTDGTVKCWGDNSAGELGDGTEIDRVTPVDVTTAYNTTATASGANTAAPAIVVISALVGALAIFA